MKQAECRMQNEGALRRVLHYFRLLPSACCLLLVRLYQLTLSPARTVLLGPAGHCRFEPSCSQYAVEALKSHGALNGSWLAAKRICRCHPWGAHGADPVPPVQSTVHSPQSTVGAASTSFEVMRGSKDPGPELRVSNVGFL
jgi:putative membrane protein insertion efficiency factor